MENVIKCIVYNSVNPLSTNPTKWSNTLKQFVSNLLTNFLSVFDRFVKLALTTLNCRGTGTLFEVQTENYNYNDNLFLLKIDLQKNNPKYAYYINFVEAIIRNQKLRVTCRERD